MYSENSNVNFTIIGLLIEEIKVKLSFLNFTLKSLHVTSQISNYSSYFGNIGSTKFSETWYVESLAPSEDNLLHFY